MLKKFATKEKGPVWFLTVSRHGESTTPGQPLPMYENTNCKIFLFKLDELLYCFISTIFSYPIGGQEWEKSGSLIFIISRFIIHIDKICCVPSLSSLKWKMLQSLHHLCCSHSIQFCLRTQNSTHHSRCSQVNYHLLQSDENSFFLIQPKWKINRE